jgi:hypothetical protein
MEIQLSKIHKLKIMNSVDWSFWFEISFFDSFIFKSLSISILGFVCCACAYLTYHLKYYFFPRKHQFPEAYPFESSIMAVQNVDCFLDTCFLLLNEVKTRFNRKTVVINTIGVSHFVLTSNIENITYILKTKFEKFGEAGAEFKPKF